MIRSFVSAVAFACLVLAGCGPAKLDITRNYNMDGLPQVLILDPQPKAQKVTVEYESSASEVVVMIIKASDVPKEEEGIVPTSKALAFKKDKSGTFTADVPEKTETFVIVRGGTKTDVKLRVHNQ